MMKAVGLELPVHSVTTVALTLGHSSASFAVVLSSAVAAEVDGSTAVTFEADWPAIPLLQRLLASPHSPGILVDLTHLPELLEAVADVINNHNSTVACDGRTLCSSF